MRPGVYLHCLEICAERDGLVPPQLVPVSLADVIAVQSELSMTLPGAYEEFLVTVGVGEEHGGLGVWFHLDLGRTGNLLEANEGMAEAHGLPSPKRFLAIYESRGEGYYGFAARRGGRYREQVSFYDLDSGEFEEVAGDLFEFLESNVDCNEREIEIAESRYQNALQQSRGEA